MLCGLLLGFIHVFESSLRDGTLAPEHLSISPDSVPGCWLLSRNQTARPRNLSF